MPERDPIDILAADLKEAADAHHAAEKRLPKHDWQLWYAAYLMARRGQQSSPAFAVHYADMVTLRRLLGRPTPPPPQ